MYPRICTPYLINHLANVHKTSQLSSMGTVPVWYMRSPSSVLILNSRCMLGTRLFGLQRTSSRFVFIPPAASLNFIPRRTRRILQQEAHSGQRSFRYQMSTRSDSQYEEFFRYTSGRWIWDEEQQLRDRFRRFDVPELQRVAAASVGASKCISMTKMAEGSFNKVFRLLMDNGRVAIARIPNPNAGPAYYTTASEVATMDFVGIPILFSTL